MILNWKATRAEHDVIAAITKRAVAMAEKNGSRLKTLDLNMDITACHLNAVPLKLDELLKADDFNFAHDVFGIYRHFDRETGQLKDCFLPRFAA